MPTWPDLHIAATAATVRGPKAEGYRLHSMSNARIARWIIEALQAKPRLPALQHRTTVSSPANKCAYLRADFIGIESEMQKNVLQPRWQRVDPPICLQASLQSRHRRTTNLGSEKTTHENVQEEIEWESVAPKDRHFVLAG